MKQYLFYFVFIILFIFGCFFYLKEFINKKINLNEDKIIFIDKGSGFIKVLDVLEKEDIIDNKYLFRLIATLKTKNNIKIYSGEYIIKKDDKISNVLNKILKGEIFYRKITFAEGLSSNTIIKKINENEFLTGEPIEREEEGVLLPNTYLFNKGDTRQSIVDRMKFDMNNVLDNLWETRNKDLPIKTKYEALILASIVEKETGVPLERSIIAGVFVNRLRQGIRLQTDPTIVYGFSFGDISKERTILKSDLNKKTPYNTYKIYGLPPTPIANPGVDSIKAVLNPSDTKYLYFVATGNGGHHFSETYTEHLNFVRNYRKILKEKKL